MAPKNIKSEIIRTYDATVKEYAKHEYIDPESNFMGKYYSDFIFGIKKGGLILDAGCGPGQASEYFIKKGYRTIGFDLSPKMIDYARKKVKTGQFYVMDVEKIRLKMKFDGIWAAFILVHIPRGNHKKILKKFYNLLVDGGMLYLGMIEGRGEKYMPEPYNNKYNQFFVYVTKKEITEVLTEVGFKVITYSVNRCDEEGNIFNLSSIIARKKIPS